MIFFSLRTILRESWFRSALSAVGKTAAFLSCSLLVPRLRKQPNFPVARKVFLLCTNCQQTQPLQFRLSNNMTTKISHGFKCNFVVVGLCFSHFVHWSLITNFILDWPQGINSSFICCLTTGFSISGI